MIYLNNAATTKIKPQKVIDAVNNFLQILDVSPGRGTDKESLAADDILTCCRRSLAKLFSIDDSNQIIFTLNCSDALNTALKGVLKKGDHVIISPFEHNSIVRPLKFLENYGIETSVAIGCSVEGVIEPNAIKHYIKKNTKLIACLHASNVTGAIQPIEEIGKIAKENNLLFLVDAAQTAGILDIDVKKNNIDLLAFAGHKGLMGPQGTGGLYIGKKVKEINPLRHGGTGTQSENEIQPETMPDKFETGTPNTPGIAGLLAALEFIFDEGISKIRKHDEELTHLLIDGLKKIKNVALYGPMDAKKQAPVVSFNIEGLHPKDVSKKMEKEFGIIIRAGLHCSPLCHRSIGTFPQGSARISMGYFNTKDDVEKAIEAVFKIAKQN